MRHRSIINLSLYIIFILLGVSAVFLFKDIRSGEVLHSKFNFFAASIVHDKKPCNKVKTTDCIPDPLSLLLGAAGVNQEAKAAPEEAPKTSTTSTEPTKDTAQGSNDSKPANIITPRFH